MLIVHPGSPWRTRGPGQLKLTMPTDPSRVVMGSRVPIKHVVRRSGEPRGWRSVRVVDLPRRRPAWGSRRAAGGEAFVQL